MEALLNRYRHLTVLVVVIFAQLLLLAWQVKTDQDVRLIRVWAVTAVTPLARALEFLRANTIGIAENYFVLVDVREQNQRLANENGRLKLENQFLKTELQTAERARLLSAFQERTPSRTLAARIIGNGTGTNSKVVFIDRGSTAGVMKGMAVVTPDGIVGKIIGAYPTASQVQLITDGTFSAGVVSEKHRVHGTVKGTGESKTVVDYVQNEEAVDKGEMFYTSGYDRVFPRGLPVGAATVVRNGREHKDIYLVPAAFQHPLEEVLVVLEGVHQNLPAPGAESSESIKILPPPPADGSEAPQDLRSALTTEADRLRERYRKIGEAQGHKFGEGLPGSKPPDFNLNPDARTQAPAAGAAGQTAVAGTPAAPAAVPQVRPPAAAAAKMSAPAAAGSPANQLSQTAPAAAKPKPPSTTALTGAPAGTPAVKPRPLSPLPSGQPVRTGEPAGQTAAPAAKLPKPAATQPAAQNPAAAKPKAAPAGALTGTPAPAAAKPKPPATGGDPAAVKPRPAAPKSAPSPDETTRNRDAAPARPKSAAERSVNLPIP